MKTKNNKKVLGVYVDDQTKKELSRMAKESHRSTSAMVALILEQYIKSEEKK